MMFVFFCLAGWVCTASVIGAPPANGANEADQGVFADQPADGADAGEEAAAESPRVTTGAFGKIDLHVKDLEISKVLQLLSIQSKRNIVASRNVAGTVTADLYNVDFYEALNAVLKPNGFGYREKGQFIFVYTSAELTEIEKQEKKTLTAVVRLNYLTAPDAVRYVTPLLSSAGSIANSELVSGGFQPSITEGGANTNALGEFLVVRDYPENLDEIRLVLKKLDVRPQQVEIEVCILQVTIDDSDRFGVDFSVVADLNISDFANPTGLVSDLFNGTPANENATAIDSGVGNTQAADKANGFKVGVVNDNISVFVDALAQVRDTVVLAKPKLLVLNRQRAEVLIGSRDGYVTSTTTDTATSTSVEFLETGTQLTVRPFVSQDGFVRLELRPSISSGEVTEIAQTAVPTEITQELTTNVNVRSGQTVILGGLFEETTTVAKRQVPWLGDIPVLGMGFKGQDDTVQRSEYIFMVRATVVNDEKLHLAGDLAKEGVEMARIGARMGLLPWSREKLTAHHVSLAVKELNRGDTRRALIYTNWALNVEPNLFEARRMKEQLLGERMRYPTTQIMENAVDTLVKASLVDFPEEQDMDGPADEAAPVEAGEAEDAEEAPMSDDAAADASTATGESDAEAGEATASTELEIKTAEKAAAAATAADASDEALTEENAGQDAPWGTPSEASADSDASDSEIIAEADETASDESGVFNVVSSWLPGDAGDSDTDASEPIDLPQTADSDEGSASSDEQVTIVDEEGIDAD